MTEPDEFEGDYSAELLMPFVVCASHGGPFDDVAFCAGYECGTIAARLEIEQPAVLQASVRTANVPQFDLIAMHTGYAIAAAEFDQALFEGWSRIEFRRIPAEAIP